MIASIQKISFKQFRGLPDYQLKFKGNKLNLLLHAGNGKGKSSIVQGIEWLFDGEVEDLSDTSLRNIDAKDSQKTLVSIGFSDGSDASRELSPGAPSIGSGSGFSHLQNHPAPNSFILRRAKLLGFMQAKPGRRYQEVLDLMNLDWINETHEAIQQAYDAQKTFAKETQTQIQINYNELPNLSSTESFKKAKESLLAVSNDKLIAAKFEPLVGLEDIDSRLKEISKARNPENQKRLAKVETALSKFSETIALAWESEIAEVNSVREKIRTLEEKAAQADQLELISAAHDYFKDNKSLSACPVCERDFDEACSYSDVFENLIKRSQSLGDIREAKTQNEKLTTRLSQTISEQTLRLNNAFLSSLPYITEKELIESQEHLDIINLFRQTLLSTEKNKNKIETTIASSLTALNTLREKILKLLESQRDELNRSLTKETEEVYTILFEAHKRLPILESLNAKYEIQCEQERQAEKILQAFKQARNTALKKILSEIADTVKEFYDLIHQDDDRCEFSECTAITLKPSGQGGGKGILQFMTDFFNKIQACDPRQYLSEGHLDSLGLCIYLASVKHFNPRGSLLVLDDVLTSIDKDHRHKVTDLIFEKFSEYQIIITTHDDPWFSQLKGRIQSVHNDSWKIHRFGHWTREDGPVDSPSEGSRISLEESLKNKTLVGAGGPMRILAEEVCQKTAEALDLKMPYRRSGDYTLPIFNDSGLGDKLKKGIQRIRKHIWDATHPSSAPLTPKQKQDYDDKTDKLTLATEKVIGCSFLNELVHKKPDLEAIPSSELKDFSENLLLLHEFCCNRKNLALMKP